METKEIAINVNDAKLTLDKYLLFEYTCVEQKQQGQNIYFKFERDDSVPYIEELRKLEESYPKFKIGSMLSVTLMPIVTFVLATIFLVVFLIDKQHFNFTLMFSLLMIPALLILVLTVVFTVVRLRRIRNIEKTKDPIDQEIREKIAELKAKK